MIATLEETQSLQHASSRAVVASLESVSMNYGEVRALRNVNFTVRSGQVVGEQLQQDVRRRLAAGAVYLGHGARESAGAAHYALGRDRFSEGELDCAVISY